MSYFSDNWQPMLVGALAGAALVLGLQSARAEAADLGGGCCADLEERIADLEATTARKGNRKVSVTIYGEVNKAILFYDMGDNNDESVIDNSASPSFVGVSGTAQVGKDWWAGYVLEVGVGGRSVDDYTLSLPENDLYVHRSYVYIKSPVGAISLGKASQATDDLDLVTTANTTVAVRPLSLRPFAGPESTEALDIFDGTRAQVVRIDSTPFGGFVLSAAWASDSVSSDEVWDVALRYAGEFGGFRVAGAAGYRSGVVVETGLGPFGVGADDLDVYTLVGSIMHMQTGLFITGNYGSLDVDVFDSVEGYAVTGGIERKWMDLGRTTLFLEYGQLEEGEDLDYWGGGIVQNIEGAALDLYLNGRQYDAADEDATAVTAGARIKF